MAEGQPVLGQQRLGLAGRAARPRARRSSRPASTETSRSSRARSSATTPASPSRRAASPPTTDVPPPNGTTRDPVLAAPGEHARRPRRGRRAGPRRRGRRQPSPARIRSRSGVDLPRVCRTRVSSSVCTCVGADQVAQPVEQRRRRAPARAAGPRRAARRGAPRPGRRPARPGRGRPRAAAASAAGSPQRGPVHRCAAWFAVGHALQCDT